MAVEFHDGNHKLYGAYSQGKAWNDNGLLRLSMRDQYDRMLIDDYNNEAKIAEMLKSNVLSNCRPFGVGTSKLSEYIGAQGTGIIIIKGLHQWKRVGRYWDYKLHLSFGLEGQLWHLYARYMNDTGNVTLTNSCSAGERVTGESHDGFVKVGRGKRR